MFVYSSSCDFLSLVVHCGGLHPADEGSVREAVPPGKLPCLQGSGSHCQLTRSQQGKFSIRPACLKRVRPAEGEGGSGRMTYWGCCLPHSFSRLSFYPTLQSCGCPGLRWNDQLGMLLNLKLL